MFLLVQVYTSLSVYLCIPKVEGHKYEMRPSLRPIYVLCLPEIPTLPKPKFPEIQKPELPTLPKPEFPEITKPKLPTLPKLEIPSIPNYKPELPTLPKP
ncbi:hypothetical protein MTR67_016322 [Solanum verrucosum]|uniref:Gamma-gliadin n=1 Tax=Solanum verrucosum TaxID=315347 RepID=A0AAF0QHK0_SOLVR|nr:hypothetical protein MTR67_016322 [Solanum verrucosum]